MATVKEARVCISSLIVVTEQCDRVPKALLKNGLRV